MPNWVYTTMKVTGKPETVTKFFEDVKSDQKDEFDNFIAVDFNKHVPMPEEIKNTTSPNRDEKLAEMLLKKYNASDWYDWSIKNWGTKWNAVDVGEVFGGKNYVGVSFQTAWSFPESWAIRVSELYPELTFRFYTEEESGLFRGKIIVKNGILDDSHLKS